jgi:hypothetical protein
MIHPRRILSLAVFVLAFNMVVPVLAGPDIERAGAAAVCRRWLETMVAVNGDWAGDSSPSLSGVELIVHRGIRVGWHCTVDPSGYVIVPLRRELAPIKAYSERGLPDPSAVSGLLGLALDDLAQRTARLEDRSFRNAPEHPAWARFDDDMPNKDSFGEAGPLLQTRWAQGWPYNADCPTGDGGQTFVGCTALAAAQLMRHHAWPTRGIGAAAYWWDGDDGCGGSTPGDTLRADLTNPYDWAAMTDEVGYDDPPDRLAAVAELCYETAVACRMDFSVCGSSASLARARSALVNHFHYLPSATERQRFHMSDDAWFTVIRDNVDRGLPLIYSSTIHTMVCDGWREIDGLRLIHINYGWGGDSDGWFALDAVETSLNPAAERLLGDVEPDLSTPIALDTFTAERISDGAQLSWRVGAVAGIDGLHVWRGCGDDDPVRLTPEPLDPTAWMTWTDHAPPLSAVAYWLEEVVEGGGQSWYGPVLLAAAARGVRFRLSPPSPNPCNPLTTLQLNLDQPGHIRAVVHDGRGRVVAELVDGRLPVGRTVLRWDGRTSGGRMASSGIYLVRVSASGYNQTRKLLLTR